MNILLTMVLSLLVGHWLGSVRTHYMVATECDIMSGFFVDERVYKCTLVDKKKEQVQQEKELK